MEIVREMFQESGQVRGQRNEHAKTLSCGKRTLGHQSSYVPEQTYDLNQ